MASLVTCSNCSTQNRLPDQPLAPGQRARCGKCGAFLPAPSPTDDGTRAVAAASGGALLGWSLGGPPGAIIGGLAGFLASKVSEK